MLNDYNQIGKEHHRSHSKPDKQFSMLPTILKLAQPLKDKTIIDVGCGDGFFTGYFSKSAKMVYGIDNSLGQIQEAKKIKKPNLKFIFGDMLTIDYPKADLINVPYVLGYLRTENELITLFAKFHNCLYTNGKVLGLIDSPQQTVHNNQKFGSIKRIKSCCLKEGVKINIELYDKNEKMVTLHAYYHTKEMIEKALNKAGFSKVEWPKPIISKEGIKKYGQQFWNEYLNNCDVAYFTAVK